MWTRHSNGIDANTRITETLDTEAGILAQIDQDEISQRLGDLPHSTQPVSYLGLYKDYTNIMKEYIYER